MANDETMAYRAPDSEIDAIAMGARVRAIRQMLGLSSAELALRAGLSVGVISQIERGQAIRACGRWNDCAWRSMSR